MTKGLSLCHVSLCHDAFDGIHRPADHLPVGEIPRAQDGELFPVRCLAGADGIVGVAHLEGVGVGEG